MTKIEVDLVTGSNDTMRIAAHVVSTEGHLVVHRQVAYVPGKEEHKFTSKWQITHRRTGKGLLRPSQCLPTMTAATKVAVALEPDFPWELDRLSPADEQRMAKHIRDLVAKYEAEKPDPKEVVTRYVTRKIAKGYGVIDSETDTEIEVHLHRGMAAERAKELNEGVSV
jgi:hypothetical protein